MIVKIDSVQLFNSLYVFNFDANPGIYCKLLAVDEARCCG